MLGRPALGYQNYEEVITEDIFYIDKDEETLDDTVQSTLRQIEEKRYSVSLEKKGIGPGRIRKYGFAFRGKECRIG